MDSDGTLICETSPRYDEADSYALNPFLLERLSSPSHSPFSLSPRLKPRSQRCSLPVASLSQDVLGLDPDVSTLSTASTSFKETPEKSRLFKAVSLRLEATSEGVFKTPLFLTLKVPCNNKSGGCCYEGAVDELMSHERDCKYRMRQCDSPLCRRYFKPVDRPAAYDTVCSLNCGLLSKVYQAIQVNDQKLALRHFVDCFETIKEDLRLEVKAELAKTRQALEAEEIELKSLEEEREEMVREVYIRTFNVHIGRWSPTLKCWSCCKINDIYSMGCRELK